MTLNHRRDEQYSRMSGAQIIKLRVIQATNKYEQTIPDPLRKAKSAQLESSFEQW